MIGRILCFLLRRHAWRRGHQDEDLAPEERICSRCARRRAFAYRSTW